MKFLCATAILLVLCAGSSSSASSSSSSAAREPCPKNLTRADCEKYANERVIRQNVCAKHSVSDDLLISWSHCGTRVCYGPSGEYAAKNEDLTKAYPECCPKCSH